MRPLLLLLLSPLILTAAELETKFLQPGNLLFEATFDDGVAPAKPNWMLRKSHWIIEDGVLRGTNAGGNGPFIRLHSKQNDGILPEDYILTFSFKIGENPNEKKSNKHHETDSSGHRFSFGHYAAKFQWRPDTGIDFNIGHGDAMADDRFHIERHKWYHVTAEILGDKILVSFKDGPSYFLQHDHFRDKPAGWEFFTHVSETGYLNNLRVYALTGEELHSWPKTLEGLINEKRAFFSAENPDFQITKQAKK
ncbi:MAG: hypothetical protein AAGD22_15950 [Verrucomicrobiota bacterium]